MTDSPSDPVSQPIPFKAETRQLLNILIHSLYTEREIFLRELVSNASDALTRLNFEMLTDRNVLDPDAELAIWISTDPAERTLTLTDTGVGMTAEELAENLGTIAHSGARAFVQAAEQAQNDLSQIIGQFGVGFYSAFMVAEWIRVTSRSYQPDAQAASWFCDGSDTFTLEPDEKASRGTHIVVKLKEEAAEYAQESRLRQIIKKHSDYVPFPIYLGDSAEQINHQTALWRQQPRQVQPQEYDEFYRQLTLDSLPPLQHIHMAVDAPVQLFALLYIPASPERHIFSLRKEDGLMLYSRKVLIQEYSKELLPEYLGFIQGVVDSEDLPLNVSRESVQANRVMVNLKNLVTNKILDTLKSMGKEAPEKYEKLWEAYARSIKQGIAVEPTDPERLFSLLRFHTTINQDHWSSLNDYVGRMKPDQKAIYYILADDERSGLKSPHLEPVRRHGFEALLLADPIDPFMLVRLTKYEGYDLVNVAAANLELPGEAEATSTGEDQPGAQDHTHLVERFKTILGERVTDVRTTERLVESPARLVDSQGAPNQEMQRVYRLLDKDFQVPKKVLEINPRHPIIASLGSAPEDNAIARSVIEQVFENALLIEGLHPDPASMIGRIQEIMESALASRGTAPDTNS